MPAAAPTTHGNPRTIPAADPVAVIITLLGPGVIAATSEKMRKGRICSRVMGLLMGISQHVYWSQTAIISYLTKDCNHAHFP